MLGPAGERWAPIHGITALSKAPELFTALQTVFASMADRFADQGISIGYLFTHLSTNAIIIEPVFYWPEERFPVHEAGIEPAHLARLPTLAANPAATEVVRQARHQVLAIFEQFGCAHFQIGRTYPYRASRDAASWALLQSIKSAVDPSGALNPGVLGLDPSGMG
jgi:hypothetical protein